MGTIAIPLSAKERVLMARGCAVGIMILLIEMALGVIWQAFDVGSLLIGTGFGIVLSMLLIYSLPSKSKTRKR